MMFASNQYSFRKKKILPIENSSAPSASTFHTFQLFRLQDRFEMKLLTFVNGSFQKFFASCFLEFFDILSQVHQDDTRQARKGNILLTRKTALHYGLKSIRYSDAKSLNSISLAVNKPQKLRGPGINCQS